MRIRKGDKVRVIAGKDLGKEGEVIRVITDRDRVIVDGGIAMAKRLIRFLPTTNLFRRNAYLNDHVTGGDAGLYDLLLHSCDRAYTVPQIGELTAAAGLRGDGQRDVAAPQHRADVAQTEGACAGGLGTGCGDVAHRVLVLFRDSAGQNLPGVWLAGG